MGKRDRKRKGNSQDTIGSSLMESIISLKTGRFWKSFCLDLISVVGFVVIFALFSVQLKTILPGFQEITPFAQETLAMTQKMSSTGEVPDVDLLQEKIGEIRDRTYSLVFDLLSALGLYLLLFLLVLGMVNFISWSVLCKKRFEWNRLKKYYYIIFSLTLILLVLIYLSIWILKTPVNVIIALLLIILAVYFSIFAKLLLFRGAGFWQSLKGCLRKSVSLRSLVWLLICLIASSALVLINWIVMIHIPKLTILAVPLVIVMWTLSREFLLNLHKDKS